MHIACMGNDTIEPLAQLSDSLILSVALSDQFSTWTLAQTVGKIIGVVFGLEHTTESKKSKVTRKCGMFQVGG